MSYPQIPSWLRDDDILFHYSTSEKAIMILESMRLRLSKRKESIDPIENGDIPLSVNMATQAGYYGMPEKLIEETNRALEDVNQVCFCKNSSEGQLANQTFPQFEKYGFAKPRMWDQYGDRYKGVCLIFSKKAITDKLDSPKYKIDDVNYVTYAEFSKMIKPINGDIIEKCGYEEYRDNYLQHIKGMHFLKHVDYTNESEFRICSFSKEDIFIDISKALKGVVVTNFGLNRYLGDTYLAKTENVFLLSFINNSLWFRDFKNWKHEMKEAQERKRLL